jgi:hypothetical protein
MFRTGILLAALLAASAAKADTCQLARLASLDIVTGANGEALIPVTIKGQPEYMALEIGAAHSGLSKETADALGLTTQALPNNLSAHYIAERVKYTVTVPLTLGKASGDTSMFLMLDFAHRDPRAAGVIGLDELRAFDVDLDVAAKKLNLFSPQHCPGQVVYWTQAPFAAAPMEMTSLGGFTVPMQLDGKDIHVSFALLKPRSVMTMDRLADLFNITELPGDVASATASSSPGVDAGRRYAFKSLSGNGVTVTNPEIFLYGTYNPHHRRCDGQKRYSDLEPGLSYTCYGGEADLELGLNMVRRLHLYFAFGEKMVYFTAEDAVTNSPPAPSPQGTASRK